MSLGRKLVSIIIPIKNWKKAEKCLRTIEKQTYPHIEVIKVDFEGFPAEKRNYGFTQSKGEYVFFLDEDEYLSPEVVNECVKKAEEGYDIIAVPVIKKPTKSYISNCISIIRESTFKTMFFKRKVLEDIGLFNPEFILCDDLEILQRAKKVGYEIGKIENGYIIHDEDVSLRNILFKTIFSRRSFRKLKEVYGKQCFDEIVRADLHRRRILKEVLMKPIFAPGVFFIMLLRALIRRIP